MDEEFERKLDDVLFMCRFVRGTWASRLARRLLNLGHAPQSIAQAIVISDFEFRSRFAIPQEVEREQVNEPYATDVDDSEDYQTAFVDSLRDCEDQEIITALRVLLDAINQTLTIKEELQEISLFRDRLK